MFKLWKLKKAVPAKNNPQIIMANCGHLTKLIDRVSAFGDETETEIKIFPGEQPAYCHRCLEKMACRCVWCGRTIFIGDPITLYTPNGDYVRPSYAIVYSENPLQIVGCGRSDCADTGADYAGFWLPPGKVERQSTPIETLSARMFGQDPESVKIISLR